MENLPKKLFDLWRSLSPAWKFSLVSVTAMRVFYTVWSLFSLASFSLVVQNQEIFGDPVVSVFDLQTSKSYAYNRSVDGAVLTFQKIDQTHMVDQNSRSLWNTTNGLCTSGFYMGKNLSPADISAERLFPYHGVSAHSSPMLSIWQRFDVNWYLTIAQKGYGAVSGDVHFPPLYPLFIQWLSLLLHDDLIAGLLISQSALYYLVKLLYDLFVQWGNDSIASNALFFFLIFPTSFFLFSAYTEALFMIVAILSLRSMQAGKWHWAGFWILCAILIRLQGVALLLPLAWNMLQTRFRNVRLLDLSFAALSPAIAVGVYLLLRAGVGDSSVIPFNEANLHAKMVLPWETLFYSIRYIAEGTGGYIDILNLIIFVSFFTLLVVHWKKFPIEYSLYSAASILIFAARWVDTQPLNSIIRYLLTIIPVFFLFGQFSESKWINRLMFLSFLGLNLFLCMQFFLWGWVA